jgi:hypothetical protein
MANALESSPQLYKNTTNSYGVKSANPANSLTAEIVYPVTKPARDAISATTFTATALIKYKKPLDNLLSLNNATLHVLRELILAMMEEDNVWAANPIV